MFTRNRYSLVDKSFYAQNRSVGRIAVVCTASSIQFLWVFGRRVEHWLVGLQSWSPSREGRLLVEVSIEKVSLIEISFDLNINDRSQIFFSILYNF